MSIITLGLTLSTLGKVILGIAILMVHDKMEEQHRIDKVVIQMMHKERGLTYCALGLIIIGYILEMQYYTHL